LDYFKPFLLEPFSIIIAEHKLATQQVGCCEMNQVCYIGECRTTCNNAWNKEVIKYDGDTLYVCPSGEPNCYETCTVIDINKNGEPCCTKLTKAELEGQFVGYIILISLAVICFIACLILLCYMCVHLSSIKKVLDEVIW